MPLKEDLLLTATQLRRRTDLASLEFCTTRDVECLKEFVGQERAVKAMNFGLVVQGKGYNIFVVGTPGSGRTTYSLDTINEQARRMPAPDDWIYVYNFENPSEPIAINIPSGQGKIIAAAFDELTEELKVAISKAFEKSQYEDAKAQLVKKFQEDVNKLMEEVKGWALQMGFSVKRTPQGFVNIPLRETEDEDGRTVTKELQQEEFESLSEVEQKKLQERSEQVSQRTLEVLRKIRDKEKTLKGDIGKLEAEICRGAIQPYLDDIREKFGQSEKMISWLDRLAENIIDNFNTFVAAARDENADVDFSNYKINVFVCNDPRDGAPVVWETNSTYYNLAGKVEYESRQGYLYTDFSKIKAGAVQKANGGFLVLDAERVLRNFMSWEALKRVLRTGELAPENLGEQYGAIPVSSLRPEPIPINIKVVMVGTHFLYHLLQYYDPEFQKMFKMKAEFDVDMPRTPETEKQMAQFVTTIVAKEGRLHFSVDGVGEIIEWASRLAADQSRMSIKFNKIVEVIVEAEAWAKMEGAEKVSSEHVYKAIQEKRYRFNLVEERIKRAFSDDVVHIETQGFVVGQINGLAVIDLGDYMFGHPSRITANTYMGQDGVVNIEREVKMSGPIHNKGLMTLSSYLGRKYAQDMPLSLSARLSFEQNYGGIEGDSASSTELYCLLSSLSGVPINQGIAVTGSVDQFGNIQPIGGVNEKIEGFFEYCKEKGLTGKQGVIIPCQNVKHLMLNSEVIEVVKKGLFSVWAVKTIDEGIEMLTGIPAGKLQKNGKYPQKSIHGRVVKQLNKWMKVSMKLQRGAGKTKTTNIHSDENNDARNSIPS